MRIVKTLTVIAAVLAAVAAAQMPAAAHGDKVYHGKDFATVAPDHMSGSVCDEERDGHRVYGIWYTEGGGEYINDARGSDGPCTNTNVFDSPAYLFKVCEEGKGCRQEWT